MALPASAAWYSQYSATYLGQNCNFGVSWVKFSEQDDPTMQAATDALNAYLSDAGEPFLDALLGLLTNQVEVTRCRTLGMATGVATVVADAKFSAAGTRTGSGDAVNSFTAMSFSTGSPAYGRHGARIALPSAWEGDTVGNNWNVTGGFATAISTLLIELNGIFTVVTDGSGPPEVSFVTGVIKRIPYFTPSGNPASRLPTETADIVDALPVPDFSFNTSIRSQVGRRS